MEGHKYFIEGIPLALWKEFKLACLYYDTTAKAHLLSCMQTLIVRYHKSLRDHKPGATYNLNGKDKK